MADRFLVGKVAAVTGGASGMGRAMAMAFAAAGVDVAVGSLMAGGTPGPGEVAHLPPLEALEACQIDLTAHGVRALALQLDVTRQDSIEAFFSRVEGDLGPVDILANAAGITAEHPVCEHPERLWAKVLEVNLTGTFRAIRRVLPGMIQRSWGRVVNIASTAAEVGAATSPAYCASKAGVVGLTRCVALEGAAHGVTCNAISPSWVDTGFGRDWMTDLAADRPDKSPEAYRAEVERQNPQGRLLRPEEIAGLALYLCRDEARGMTMQNLTISAGSLW